MVCLGLEPGAARWKVQTNPLSYGGTPYPLFIDCTLERSLMGIRWESIRWRQIETVEITSIEKLDRWRHNNRQSNTEPLMEIGYR